MNLRQFIHTVFFTVYIVFNLAVYQFISQIEFTALGVFVLAPLAIIVEAGILFAMDEVLVKVLCPAEEAESSLAEQFAVQRDGLLAHVAFVKGVSFERRINSGKLWKGSKDRRHSPYDTPLAT